MQIIFQKKSIQEKPDKNWMKVIFLKQELVLIK